MEEKTFELVPVLDKKTGQYEVKDFGKVKAIVADFIEREVAPIKEITDDVMFKSTKELRTDIRKKKDAITQARIQINSLLLGTFNGQLKDIEAMLDSSDKVLKEKVDAYNELVKGKDNKPKVITLVVKGFDPKAIEKIKALALKSGCTAEVK